MDIIMGTREKKPAGKKKLVDFHCHILPEMDDGAKSPIESVQMLEILYRQNVTGCILTFLSGGKFRRTISEKKRKIIRKT